MKKALFTIFLFLFFSTICVSQKDSTLKLTLIKSYNGDIVDFTTDNLGNIYTINSSNQLKKFNDNGDSIASINDIKRFGKISGVDATNPLKVLVYYKEFSRLVVLDRLLNIRNSIDLRQQNIFQVQAFTTSYDNNIWIYDELESKLKKLDDNGKVLSQSNDLRQVFDSAPSPISMFDRDGLVYLYDPTQGLSSFDYYGGLKNNIQLRNINDLQVLDKNTITGRDSTHIVLYKPATLQILSFTPTNSIANFSKVQFSGSKVYALNRQGQLFVYSALK